MGVGTVGRDYVGAMNDSIVSGCVCILVVFTNVDTFLGLFDSRFFP